MKYPFLYLLIIFAAATTATRALSPLQHPLTGVVCAVNVEKHVLTLASAEKVSPTGFQIKDGRTRLWRDGKPATLADLTADQVVQLCSKRETGQDVATKVTWKSPAPADKPMNKT